jgi:HNH endonuclease/NUMOD4 motif
MDDSTETWRPVLGYEGLYEVSDLGRVRSLDRIVRNGYGTRKHAGRILALGKRTYWLATLSKDGVRKSHDVHVLVAEAFLGPRPPGMYCCHHDDDKDNNRADNLRWDTPGNNNRDTVRNGGHACIWKPRRTHCPKGHELTLENSYPRKGTHGSRICRECSLASSRRYQREVRRGRGKKRVGEA